MRKEYSVYVWHQDDHSHSIRMHQKVSIKKAVEAAKALTEFGRRGVYRKVVITDGDDFCCFQWKHGEVTFPRRETPPNEITGSEIRE